MLLPRIAVRPLVSFLMAAVVMAVGCGRSFNGAQTSGLHAQPETISLKLSLSPVRAGDQSRSTMAVVQPVSAGNINHVTVTLSEIADGDERPLKDETGAAVSADVPRSTLGEIINFSGLMPERKYRIRTFAYKEAGAAPEAKISKDDESFLDIETHRADLVTFAPIPVALVDAEFGGKGSSALHVSPGVIRQSGGVRVLTFTSSLPPDAVPFNGIFALAGYPSGGGLRPLASAQEVAAEKASGSVVVSLDSTTGTADKTESVFFRVSIPGVEWFLRVSFTGTDQADMATMLASGQLSTADPDIRVLADQTASVLGSSTAATYQTQALSGDGASGERSLKSSAPRRRSIQQYDEQAETDANAAQAARARQFACDSAKTFALKEIGEGVLDVAAVGIGALVVSKTVAAGTLGAEAAVPLVVVALVVVGGLLVWKTIEQINSIRTNCASPTPAPTPTPTPTATPSWKSSHMLCVEYLPWGQEGGQRRYGCVGPLSIRDDEDYRLLQYPDLPVLQRVDSQGNVTDGNVFLNMNYSLWVYSYSTSPYTP